MKIPSHQVGNAPRGNDPDALSTVPVSPLVSNGSEELIRRSKTATSKQTAKQASKLLAPKNVLADGLLQTAKAPSLKTSDGYFKASPVEKKQQAEIQNAEHNHDSLKSMPSPQFLQQKAFLLLPTKVDLGRDSDLELFHDDEDPRRPQNMLSPPILSEEEAKKFPPSSYRGVDDMMESSGKSRGSKGSRHKSKKRKKLKKEKSISSLSTNQWALSADDWSQWGDEAIKESEREAWQAGTKGDSGESRVGSKQQAVHSQLTNNTSAHLREERIGYLPGPPYCDRSQVSGQTSDASEQFHSYSFDDDNMTFLSFDELQSLQHVMDKLDFNQQSSKPINQHELLVEYVMMTKGMDRIKAEKVAHAFMAEQPAMKRYASLQVSEGESTSSSSRSSVAYLERRYSREGEQPSLFTETTRHSSQSSILPPIVETKHTGVESYDMESHGLPYSLSKSANTSDPWKQSTSRGRVSIRCWIIVACLIVVAVASAIGISIFIFQQDNVSDSISTDSPSMAPTYVLDDLLEAAMKLSGEKVSFTPGSPQFQAVGWMSSVDEVNTDGYGHTFTQRYATVVLYFSLAGQKWANPHQWLDPSKHECDWGASITCSFDVSKVRVLTVIDMTNNRLVGALPIEIGLLSSLEKLRLSQNKLFGPIPSTVGDLQMLGELDLSYNELTGPIPSTIGMDKDLTLLDLSYNQLDGTLPLSLYDLPLLRTLVLTRNNFSGQLDSAMQNMQALVTIDVRNNTFTGPFPFDDFEQTKNIDVYRCDYNAFSGTFPKLKGSVTSVHMITVSHNQFSGMLEVDASFLITQDVAEIEFLLYYVDMSYNNFTGPISPLLGFLPSLRHIDFSGNSFSGNFPSALSWKAIEFLAVSSNQLKGTLPQGLPTLTHLDMSFNNFSDKIPEDFCKYSGLEVLILSENQLNSTIPACMQRLWKLRFMEISDNKLFGTIPSVLGFLYAMETLNLSSNSFAGTVPTEIGDLVALRNLWLNDNLLTSSIPSELGRLTELQMLNLEDNLLTGMFPPELGALTRLSGIRVGGNKDLGGKIPSALCEAKTLNLLVEDVGCKVDCSCCADDGGTCGQ